MRTTLRIDDDVLMAVRERARRESRSVGAVLTDLARRALRAEGQVDALASEDTALYGFDPLPHRGPVVSNELVDELRDDEAL